MKKLKNKWNKYKESFKDFKWWNWIIYIGILSILALPFIWLKNNYIWILLLASIIVYIIIEIMNNRFENRASGNGIIYGNRGKGKGILFNKLINKEKKAFCNVPYGKNTEILNIKEYIQSIGDNTIIDAINNDIKVVKKIEKFEKVNVYWDDTTVYAPNFMDNELKKQYPSMPLVLAVNRHLYDASMIISVQALDRPYKILRELQTDFFIKALKTNGWSKLWNSIPILRFYISVKYRFYEELTTAQTGKLPYNAKAIANETLKHGYLTSGQATKEQYKAAYGVIKDGRIIMKKSNLSYDTRYFHELFYGYKANEINKKKKGIKKVDKKTK